MRPGIASAVTCEKLKAIHLDMRNPHDPPPAFLRDVNLNLLVSLEALLEERHLGRAALRLQVTQSAMSHGLRQLRSLLGDELLVRSGNAMLLTPRAEALAAPLARAL